MRRKGAAYLASYLQARPEVKALSSHHLCNPLPIMEAVRFINVVFMRHPIERIWSVYQYEKKQNGNTPGSKKARKSGFKKYVRWRMREDTSPTIRNFHLRQCSSLVSKPFKDIEPEHIAEAFRNVNSSMFVGVVDRYDESMILFERMIRRHDMELDLSYIRQNVMKVGKKRNMNFQERMDFISMKLGPLYDVVMQNNELDLQFYEHVHKLLDHRIRKFISDKEQLLADFKERCNILKDK
jgi:hypothetical protein